MEYGLCITICQELLKQPSPFFLFPFGALPPHFPSSDIRNRASNEEEDDDDDDQPRSPPFSDPPGERAREKARRMGKIFFPLHKSARKAGRVTEPFFPSAAQGGRVAISIFLPHFSSPPPFYSATTVAVAPAAARVGGGRKPPTDTAFFAPQGC